MDLVFPPSLYCICCGNIIDGSRTYNLCDHCMEHIRWNTERPFVKNGMWTVKCTEYGLYERTLIFSLKYNNKKYIARDLARIMAERITPEGIYFDCIVPVPVSKEKMHKRGFNQCELIGKFMGDILDKPCAGDLLVRKEDTIPMRGLSPTERAENIRGKIGVNEKKMAEIQGKDILLIDDFVTTGSTAGECRRALMEGGASEVYFLAFSGR